MEYFRVVNTAEVASLVTLRIEAMEIYLPLDGSSKIVE